MAEKTKTFTQSLKRLEEILERLQDSECELEESLELLEEGLVLHKVCKDRLDKAEVKINKILRDSGKDLLES